ncbi:MAG: hypothetical protein M0R32_06035 [Candidatus Cloacimonetes bacterium]|jgi:hypothetical protein|nr:hypothetical protein [Candidatus Cloacimonadota bacterium]
MRIIKINQATQQAQPVSATSSPASNLDPKDVKTFINKFLPTMPELKSIKGNPALVNGLSQILQSFSNHSENINAIMAKFKAFCIENDKTEEGAEMLTPENQKSPQNPTQQTSPMTPSSTPMGNIQAPTSSVAPAIQGK